MLNTSRDRPQVRLPETRLTLRGSSKPLSNLYCRHLRPLGSSGFWIFCRKVRLLHVNWEPVLILYSFYHDQKLPQKVFWASFQSVGGGGRCELLWGDHPSRGYQDQVRTEHWKHLNFFHIVFRFECSADSQRKEFPCEFFDGPGGAFANAYFAHAHHAHAYLAHANTTQTGRNSGEKKPQKYTLDLLKVPSPNIWKMPFPGTIHFDDSEDWSLCSFAGSNIFQVLH